MIGESRLSEAVYLQGCPRDWTDEPGPGDEPVLDPARASDPQAWLHDQVRLWFDELHAVDEPATEGPGAWAVELGDRLKRHAAFQELLRALAGGTVDWRRLAEQLSRGRSRWRRHPELARLALGSLLALVSAARAWRNELPEAAARRQARGEPRPVQPFLEVRLQLWQRELRRMVASVGERPRLRHSMDLDKDTRRKHLPLVHCRECGTLCITSRREPAISGDNTRFSATMACRRKLLILRGLDWERTGRPYRVRTCDPRIKSPLLYQLS